MGMGLLQRCRGLDNRVYYMLAPEGQYYNYSGCGNTLNCNHPVVRKFVLDALRYWVVEMHVDGFRFDLGSIMTRAHSLWHPSLPGDDPTLTPQGATKFFHFPPVSFPQAIMRVLNLCLDSCTDLIPLYQ